MRRALRIGAGLGLALAILTCTDQSVTGPKRPGIAALNLSAWANATPGTPHVPVDSLEVILRRSADQSLARDTTFGFLPDTLKGDSAIVQFDVALSQTTEAFDITVRAFGAGSDWYHFTGSGQLTAGSTAVLALTGQYVGAGANAARVQMLPADTSAVGGTSFGLHAKVFDAAGNAIAGVPIGYRLSDTTRGKVVYPTPFSATLTAALSLRDSAWVVAETPTHLKDSTRVHLIPQPVQLVKVSGDNQTGVLNGALRAPFLVRLVDAFGAGFKGDSVKWSLTAGSGTLTAPASVTDTGGYAQVTLTPTALGTLTVQAAAAAISTSISGSPVTFTAAAGAGNVRKVVISPKIDTVAFGTPVTYAATLYDSLGNVVTATVLWSSTITTVATVSSSGVASTVGGDSTRIIASSGGYADTARLFVRVLRTITLAPADTVITAVGDSVQLRTTALDNFGTPVTSGLKIKYLSASTGVVKVDSVTAKAKLLGPGNGVVLAIDTVAPTIVVQGSATLRVNQVPFGIVNNPKDSVIVGVNGQTQIVATAVDSNGFAIPGKTFAWVTRPLGVTGGTIASVTNTGLVTGVAFGSTYAVDTLLQGLGVLRDSTKVVVSPTPPALLQWGFDSTAVGNGGNVAIGLAVTTPPTAALTVTITSSDTTIAKASPNTVTIGAGASATSATIYGYKAGRAVLTASAPGYTSKSMIVGVVSTITFREVTNPCCQQAYFYLNQNETHKAQVWLSDPAPPGGLGITFVYGHGYTAVTPSPAVIPAGQLSADIVFHGVTPGTAGQADSVVPTEGGYIGKFSYVYVAPDSLRVNLPYPYNGILGVGQVLQPYVSFTYAMDHPLLVSAQLSSAIGATPALDTVIAGATNRFFAVKATAPGIDTLTLTAPGWVPVRAALTFTTPHLVVGGTTSEIAGTPSPSRGYWTVTSADSLHYGHPVGDTLRATLVSRDTTIVAVDSPTVKVLPTSSGATVSNALRAQPGAGGRTVWLVASAPAYTSDSFQMSVQAPALTLSVSYPYDGRVAVGTFFQNAGYVSIPYARTDTFWVVFAHSKKSVVAGPDSVPIPKGQTTGYFNTRGDTLSGTDSMTIARATGYVVPATTVVLHVDSLHVRPYSYPSGLYTISSSQATSAYAYDAVNSAARPLVAPLTVALSSSKATTFTLDSATVTIPAGAYISNLDSLRIHGPDTIGAFIHSSTPGSPGSTPDSVGPIKVLPTPLAISFAYPYNGYVGRGLKLQNSYVTIPAAAPNTVTVALQRYNRLKDSLSLASVLIVKGSSSSQPFDVLGFDSTGTDSVTATAPGFVTARGTVHDTAAALALSGINPSHLTTEPAQYVSVYTGMRQGYYQSVINTDTVSVKSSDSTVIRVDSIFVRGDSGLAPVPAGLSTGTFKISYVGSGTARIRVSAPGFDSASSPPISVTGPSLYLGYTTLTTGVGQVFTGEYVYVNNAVTSPLVITLLRSDSSTSSPFTLSASVDTILAGNTSTLSSFNVTGLNAGSALLIARAPGYTQATANVAVGQPQFAPFTGIVPLYIGAAPTSVPIVAEDQTGAARAVASTVTVSATSTAPTVALPDSATLSIAASTAGTTVGVQGLLKGTAAIIFSSPGYKSDTLQVSVDTGQLVLSPSVVVPVGSTTTQMYVAVPYTTMLPVTVSLTSSDPTILGVPATVMIPANSSIVYFNVTGVKAGTVTVSATAVGERAATPVSVTVQ